jgi:Homeodomain
MTQPKFRICHVHWIRKLLQCGVSLPHISLAYTEMVRMDGMTLSPLMSEDLQTPSNEPKFTIEQIELMHKLKQHGFSVDKIKLAFSTFNFLDGLVPPPTLKPPTEQTFTVEQVEWMRRLRKTGINNQELSAAFFIFEILDGLHVPLKKPTETTLLIFTSPRNAYPLPQRMVASAKRPASALPIASSVSALAEAPCNLNRNLVQITPVLQPPVLTVNVAKAPENASTLPTSATVRTHSSSLNSKTSAIVDKPVVEILPRPPALVAISPEGISGPRHPPNYVFLKPLPVVVHSILPSASPLMEAPKEAGMSDPLHRADKQELVDLNDHRKESKFQEVYDFVKRYKIATSLIAEMAHTMPFYVNQFFGTNTQKVPNHVKDKIYMWYLKCKDNPTLYITNHLRSFGSLKDQAANKAKGKWYRYDKKQLWQLEKSYRVNANPSKKEKTRIMNLCNSLSKRADKLSLQRVTSWYANERKREATVGPRIEMEDDSSDDAVLIIDETSEN